METNWIDIEGYSGFYQINKDGEVKSSISGKILKYRKTRGGYIRVALFKNRTMKQFLLHRLLGIAYISNPEKKPCINHIDGNKRNNTLDNLEWCTHSENMIHSFKNGLQKSTWGGKLGKDNKMYKIVDQYTKEGVFIRSFFGGAEASRITGTPQPYISMACRGKRNSDKNFIWKRAS